MQEKTDWGFVATLAALLGLVAVGKLLAVPEQVITARVLVGRVIVTVALGLGVAYSLAVWLPNMNQESLLGVAILTAVLGEAFVETAINRVMGVKKSGKR